MDMETAKKRFEKIYRDEADAVFRFCLWKVSDRETALDIAQECFMRYWREMTTKKIGNDRALLFAIARNLVIDRYREKKADSLDRIGDLDDESFEIPDDKALEAIEVGAEAREAMRAIESLSPPSRQAVYLRFVEDLGPKEIARILGIRESAASVRIHRGVEELRRILKRES